MIGIGNYYTIGDVPGTPSTWPILAIVGVVAAAWYFGLGSKLPRQYVHARRRGLPRHAAIRYAKHRAEAEYIKGKYT